MKEYWVSYIRDVMEMDECGTYDTLTVGDVNDIVESLPFDYKFWEQIDEVVKDKLDSYILNKK